MLVQNIRFSTGLSGRLDATWFSASRDAPKYRHRASRQPMSFVQAEVGATRNELFELVFNGF
jgi:hypothetical protein